MRKFLFCIFLMIICAGVFAQVNPSEKTYNIGDIGPAKGIVFYDKGVFSNGWRYLEAAPVETEFKSQWGAYKQDVQGTLQVLGSGKRNTELIIKQGGKAATLCAELNFEGFSDWFLPSKDELDLMYKNLKQNNLGDFSNNGRYWSSTQFSRDTAHTQVFNNGSVPRDHKDQIRSVRAVRAF